MIQSPFFSTEGLTSTSANYLANKAKNYYTTLEDKLNHLCFFQTDMQIAGMDVTTVDNGTSKEIFDKIEQDIKDIAEAKSLIAWLREAIKERENFVHQVEVLNPKKYSEETGDIQPIEPNWEEPMSQKEYLNSLSIKDRQRYLTLETYAATIGQLIHPDGGLFEARKAFNEAIVKPFVVKENGRDTIIYSRTQNFRQKEVDDLFFKLQNKQREYQAEFNGMKHKMDLALEADRIKVETEFQAKLAEFKPLNKEFNSRFKIWKEDKMKEVQKLKIVIPNNLKEIYEKINSL